MGGYKTLGSILSTEHKGKGIERMEEGSNSAWVTRCDQSLVDAYMEMSQ